MTAYTYPSNDLERADLLLSLLGSHWQHTYAGHDLVRGYVAARAEEEQQAFRDLLETFASLCRLDVPLFHTDNWYLLTLKASERNSDPLRYDEDGMYGGPYFYDVAPSRPVFAYPIPAELADVPVIFNRLTSPSLTLTRGVDFIIDRVNQRIVFREDPLESGLLAQREVFTDDQVTDTEGQLWLFTGQFDWRHAYTHFGYVLSLYAAESTEHYSDLINTILDALVEGSTQKHVQLALAAMAGIPLVMEAAETVELVQRDNNHLVIATDRHVYRYHREDTADVAVGDVVYAGQCLTTALQVFEFNRGEVSADLRSLTMDAGFVTGFVDGLTFNNVEVPLVVEENVDGYTKVSFALGGYPTDVDLFWDTVHDRGISSGTTLAHLLDVRGPGAPSEPTVASLPAVINPLEFLISNILRYHGFAIKLNTAVMSADAYGFQQIACLRKIIPPWTALLLIFEMGAEDTIELTGAGTWATPGYAESARSFPATDLATDTFTPANFGETVTIRLVEGLCE